MVVGFGLESCVMCSEAVGWGGGGSRVEGLEAVGWGGGGSRLEGGVSWLCCK